MTYNEIFQVMHKREKLISYLVAIVCLIPVFQNRQFYGMDVAAHQHNSFLINELIFNSESPLHDTYAFNPILVPNYSGHVALSFLMLFTDAATATKLLLFLLGLFTFYAFRSLLNAIKPGSEHWVWLVLPLFWNTFLHFGFFNFLFSVPFGMLLLSYVIHYNKTQLKKYLILSFIMMIGLWFSHVSVFFVICLIVFFIAIFFLISAVKEKKIRSFIITNGILFTLFLPFLFFTFLYFKHFPSGTFTYIDRATLYKMFIDGSAMVSLTTEELMFITRNIDAVLILILFSSIYSFFYKRISLSDWLKGILILTLLGSLYLIMPDADGKGGYMSMRLLLILYFAIVIFLSILLYEMNDLKIVVGLFIVFFTIKTAVFKQTKSNELDIRARQVEEFEKKINPNSSVFVYSNCENWLINHFSNLIGIHKPVVIYENYECQNHYFPLVWKSEKLRIAIGEVMFQNRQLDEAFTTLKMKKPDFVYFASDVPERVIIEKAKFKHLDSFYVFHYKNEMGELYKLRPHQK